MFKKICTTIFFAIFSLIIFTSCALMLADSAEQGAYEITPGFYTPATAYAAEALSLGVTLEAAYIGQSEVLLIITNNTAYEVIYNDGHDFSLLIDGNITPFGSGSMGNARFTLPPGESREISFGDGVHFWPGEFRLAKTIQINEEEHELYVEFLIEDEEIAPDINNFIMEVTVGDPAGAVLMLTNGLTDTRVYFDRNYRLFKNINSSWQAVPELTTRFFPDEEHFISRRQTRRVIKNWGWLHGELEKGEYRIEKKFWHYTDCGERVEQGMYAEFRVEGKPEPHPDIWGYNPFEDTSTFRAEVCESAESNANWARGRRSPALLVYTITPLWGNNQPDRRPEREPMFIENNDYLAVIGADGEPMLFADIPQGAVVDITFSGMILLSRPGILGGTILIQVVE